MPALTNHLWQSTLFGAAVWVLTLALRKNRAAVRYGLWLAASVKFLVPFSLLVSAGSRVEWRPAPAIARPQVAVVVNQISQAFTISAEGAPAPSVLPKLLMTVWFCGVVLGLLFWLRCLWRIRLLARAATPLPLALPIPVRSSSARLEPGVFGIRRPVLILPDGITARLTPEQLATVFAHELCHVRRRDNLTGAIHMMVDVVFWFHPLVWWIRTQLAAERERACDEEVVRTAGDPEVYAEGILNVCKFYLESPAACVSGITGANLKRRIAEIMGGRVAHRLTLPKRLLLAAAAVVAIALPLAIGILHAQTIVPVKFEVASVKAVDQPWLETRPTRSGGRVYWSTDLQYVVGYAYKMQPFRISGPVPGSRNIYRFDVKTDPDATEDQIRLMFRSLLADRFHMVSHLETKEADGYVLSVAKGGPKIKEAKPGDPPPPMPEWSRNADIAGFEGKIAAIVPGRGVGAITGRRVSVFQFCEMLQRLLETMVWDETGMNGNYYFALRYEHEDASIETGLPTLYQAVQRDLGLKLEKHKGPVEMLVVDSIEKTPTEN
jgi:bla regulator protein BlaR1